LILQADASLSRALQILQACGREVTAFFVVHDVKQLIESQVVFAPASAVGLPRTTAALATTAAGCIRVLYHD
jgi:hypothetical protein